MTTVSLLAWLRQTAAHDALLSAWRAARVGRIADYEQDALILAALAGKSGTSAAIGQPGGRSRLPLLAAVHAAALQLPGYPSPFTPDRSGSVVLATRQVVRREELLRLDAAGVPISPALHPMRLRADGLCAPLTGSRPVPQNPDHRLLVMRDFISPPHLPTCTVIVDAAAEDDSFILAAWQWAHEHGATSIVFEDAARRRWPQGALVHSASWTAINASNDDDADAVTHFAPLRGYAAVIDTGPQPDLAAAAALLADARNRGPFPPPLVEAATLWRRLDELVVPLADYDAACPRWHTRTLSERLDDIAEVRASQFPRGWRTWAEMCWAGIKEGLASARAALGLGNAKSAALVEVVDGELRAGRDADVALPSRIARDAVLRYLAAAGVVIPVDGRLVVRSLADTSPWGPPRATLLVAPPTYALRHRLTAADVGSLNVLCYAHETGALRTALVRNLNEPLAPIGPLTDLLPPALRASVDLPAAPPEVVITLSAGFTPPTQATTTQRLIHFADRIDAAGLAALTASATDEIGELPGDHAGDEFDESTDTRDGLPADEGPRASVPLTVAATGDDAPRLLQIPVQRTVLRILADRAVRIPVLDVVPTMLVANLDGLTAFERLRPLLVEARGSVTRMLLAAWDQALEMAIRRCGSSAELTRTLHREGSSVGPDAIAGWTDADRIGPRDADDVIRVGRIAQHPVVAANGAAIAEVMRQLRVLHQAVGRALGGTLAADPEASEQLEELLGVDAVSMVNETVVYRVLSVGPVTITRQHDADDRPHAHPIPTGTLEQQP
jgi:hypothetical protein